ncbi:hypothetical protein PYCCODRAFT_1097670 [Trametes coccinea BRFM310]|uniref:Uncharacterized protein n=1 Tax=Trametes coccinea (strain BRFM310) TaxID=1353009 RepID=A0A1Y2I9Q4_TRAC3|nr:hypothetical protein PYCCODRAFT_1097670 [Trametes coccinea BRFM310]
MSRSRGIRGRCQSKRMKQCEHRKAMDNDQERDRQQRERRRWKTREERERRQARPRLSEHSEPDAVRAELLSEDRGPRMLEHWVRCTRRVLAGANKREVKAGWRGVQEERDWRLLCFWGEKPTKAKRYLVEERAVGKWSRATLSAIHRSDLSLSQQPPSPRPSRSPLPTRSLSR